MNPQGKQIDPWKRKSEDELVNRACLQAMRRVRDESSKYKFREWGSVKSKKVRVKETDILHDSSVDDLLPPPRKVHGTNPLNHSDRYISQEMLEMQTAKMALFEDLRKTTDPLSSGYSVAKWHDRHSQLAAPLGAEVFLHCERANPAVVMGSASYVSPDDNSTISDGSLELPNGRKRFPYSEEAQRAAKTLTFKLANFVMKKHACASIIQRIYRTFIMRRKFIRQSSMRKIAATKIQWFYRKRSMRIRAARAKIDRMTKTIVYLQSIFRMCITWRKVKRIRIRRRILAITRIVRWYLKITRERRRRHGRQRRRQIHAIRIQSAFRSFRVRLDLWKKSKSQRTIALVWRKALKRRFGHFAKQLIRIIRNHIIINRVLKIQRFYRSFSYRKRFEKMRLFMISKERSRSHSEQVYLSRVIEHFVKFDKTWRRFEDTSTDNDVNGIRYLYAFDAHELFNLLDRCSVAILYANIPSNHGGLSSTRLLDSTNKTQKAKIFVETEKVHFNRSVIDFPTLSSMSRAQRTSLAILSCFVNQENGCIDAFAWSIAKDYFERPTDANTRNQHSSLGDLLGSTTQSTVRLTDQERIWKSLDEKTLLCWNIVSLSQCLQPKEWLIWQISWARRLPQSIIHQGILLRRFTEKFRYVCVESVCRFRDIHGPPRFVCKRCYEGFPTERQFHSHVQYKYEHYRKELLTLLHSNEFINSNTRVPRMKRSEFNHLDNKSKKKGKALANNKSSKSNTSSKSKKITEIKSPKRSVESDDDEGSQTNSLYSNSQSVDQSNNNSQMSPSVENRNVDEINDLNNEFDNDSDFVTLKEIRSENRFCVRNKSLSWLNYDLLRPSMDELTRIAKKAINKSMFDKNKKRENYLLSIQPEDLAIVEIIYQ